MWSTPSMFAVQTFYKGSNDCEGGSNDCEEGSGNNNGCGSGSSDDQAHLQPAP